MYCLDTSVLVDFLRGDRKVADRIGRAVDAGIGLSITHLSLCELYKGAFFSKHSDSAVEAIGNLAKTLEIIGMDAEACFEFGRLCKHLKSKGSAIPDFDVLIAATVLANNKVLVTRDRHFQSIPSIKTEKW
jgi:tRNA(fMet)-specific endonuclease VapC